MKNLIISALTACLAIGTASAAKLCVGTPWITGISILGTQSVNVGSYQDWTASVDSDYTNSDKAITWSVYSGSSYASITSPTNTSARINGIGVGTATIRATTNDGSGIYDDRTITVNPILVSSISVSCSPNPINLNAYSGCGATVSPNNATNKTISWSNNAPGGSFYGSSTPGAYVYAYAQDGSNVSGSAYVTVNNPIPCPSCHSNLQQTCSANFISNGCNSYEYFPNVLNFNLKECPSPSPSTIYGKSACATNQSGSSPSGSGRYCWCRLCNDSGRSSCGAWRYLYDGDSNSSCSYVNCAANCAEVLMYTIDSFSKRNSFCAP